MQLGPSSSMALTGELAWPEVTLWPEAKPWPEAEALVPCPNARAMPPVLPCCWLGPQHLRTPKVMAIAAVALATNTYLTIRATLATATMAITMMVMKMAMSFFP